MNIPQLEELTRLGTPLNCVPNSQTFIHQQASITSAVTFTLEDDIKIAHLIPRRKLPRKMKKAAKTMFLDYTKRREIGVHVNPTPRTKWQYKIKRRCKWNEIMTPNGEVFAIIVSEAD